MHYCCSCGKQLANSVHNETGAADFTSSYICNECEWEDFCEIPNSAASYCSLCGTKLANMDELKNHNCPNYI